MEQILQTISDVASQILNFLLLGYNAASAFTQGLATSFSTLVGTIVHLPTVFQFILYAGFGGIVIKVLKEVF